MNEIVLELFLVAVMAFFMVFGIVGCRKQRKEKEQIVNSGHQEND